MSFYCRIALQLVLSADDSRLCFSIAGATCCRAALHRLTLDGLRMHCWTQSLRLRR